MIPALSILAGAVAALVVFVIRSSRRASAEQVDRVSDDWLREHEYGEGQRGDRP